MLALACRTDFTSRGPLVHDPYQIQEQCIPKLITGKEVPYTQQKLPKNTEQAFTDLKNQSEIFPLLLKNKRKLNIISLWFHSTKLEVRKMSPGVHSLGKIDGYYLKKHGKGRFISSNVEL